MMKVRSAVPRFTDERVMLTHVLFGVRLIGFVMLVLIASSTMSTRAMAQAPSVIYPNGGETLASGSRVAIRWSPLQSAETDSVRLDYSTDGGATWVVIAERVGGTSYDWTVPALAAPAHLRVMQVTGTFDRFDTVARFKIGAATIASTSVRFNRSGTVLAVSFERSLQVRRVPSLELIWQHELDGEKSEGGPALDPTGPRITHGIGTRDAALEIWDYEVDRLVCAIADTTVSEIYTSASFSPDGRSIAVGSSGAAGVYDAQTGNRRVLFPLSSALWVAYGPTSDQVVVGWSSRQYVWSVGEGRFTDTLNTGNSKFRLDTYGKKFTVNTQDSAQVWDLTSKSIVAGFNDDGYYGGRSWLSPDGEIVAVCMASREGVRLDHVRTRRFLGRIQQRIARVTDCQIHPNLPWIVTGHETGDVIVWSTERGDTSDGTFRVTGPVSISLGLEIAFGDVRIGATRDTSVQQYVTNTGSQAVSVDSVTLAGTDAAQFAVLDPVSGFTLAPGESRALSTRFAPTSAGPKEARVEVHVGGAVLSGVVRGDGVDTVAAVDDWPERSSEDLRLTIAPNPTSAAVRISLRTRSTSLVAVTVRDVLGRRCLKSQVERLPSGDHTLWQDLSSLPGGVYFVDVSADGLSGTRPVVVHR